MSDQRHERQIRLSEVGIDGQRRISQARVALVGCGGLAAGSLPALVGAGIGYIRLIDDDLVAESNLHRQMLFTEEDLGHPKAEVAAAWAKARDENLTIEACVEHLDVSNATDLLKDVDIIIDGTDTLAARWAIDAAAQQLSLPWCFAAIERWTAQIALLNLSEGARLADLIAPGSAEPAPCSEIGVLGAAVQAVGALQASEILRHLLGLKVASTNAILIIELDAMIIRRLEIRGRQGSLTNEPEAVDLKTRTISPDALHNKILNGWSPRVIDVMQDSVDLDSVKQSTDEILLVCPLGLRSMRVAAQWLARGLNAERVFILEGGFDSWEIRGFDRHLIAQSESPA